MGAIDEAAARWRERAKRHKATAREALFYTPDSYLTPTQQAAVDRVAIFLALAEWHGANAVRDRWAEAAGDELEWVDIDAPLLAEKGGS